MSNARREHLIDEAVTHIQERLGNSREDYSERVDRPIAKAFLLRGNYFWNGSLCEPQAKHVGLGVYDVSVKKQ